MEGGYPRRRSGKAVLAEAESEGGFSGHARSASYGSSRRSTFAQSAESIGGYDHEVSSEAESLVAKLASTLRPTLHTTPGAS